MNRSNLIKVFSFHFTLSLVVSEGLLRINPYCRPPRGNICVEIRQCPYFVDLLDSTPIPRPHHVIKLMRDHQCGFQGSSPKVCCSISNPKDLAPHPAESRSDITSHPNFRLLPQNKCGRIWNDYRITSGSSTSVMEFPWMALLLYYTDKGIDFKCGGTLINERYILTAAHCIVNLTLMAVRLGEHNINTQVDCDSLTGLCAPPAQDFYLEDVIVHPEYNPSSYENDIALIRLAATANLTYENVQPICLPVGEIAAGANLKGKFAVVAGWGVTESGYRSAELLKITIPVVSNEDCQRRYKHNSKITHKQICAGGSRGKDSCGGDSGGPLKQLNYFDEDPRYVQYGIVSYGPKFCGAKGQPGVYTNIIRYTEWILDNLKPALS